MALLSAMSGIVVSTSILEKDDIGVANVHWFCILPEKRIVVDSIFSWVAGFEEAMYVIEMQKEDGG